VALAFLFGETGFGEIMLLPLLVSNNGNMIWSSLLNIVNSWFVQKAALAELLDAG